jgi:hypothetical protein
LGDRDKALAVFGSVDKWKPYLEIAEAIRADDLPTELAHEVAFAFDLITGRARELGRSIGRDYFSHGLLESEIPLTVDVVGVSSDSVFVADYKTGRSKTTEAKNNMQVGLAAVCAAQVYGRSSAVVEVIKPSMSGGRAYRDRATLDVFALDEITARMRGFSERRAAAMVDVPNVTVGDHCRYCPSYSHCPAWTSLAVRVGTGAELDDLRTISLTEENAGQALARAKVVKKFCERIISAVYGMAAQDPIEIFPGVMLGEKTKQGNEVLDGTIAHSVISDLFDSDMANESAKFSVTKASIERAARERGLSVAPTLTAIVEEIRIRGGSDRPDTTKIREYTI